MRTIKMATCYEIVCKKCRKKLWIGQWTYIYRDEPETMKKLERFLFKHEGHPLYFVNDNDAWEATHGHPEILGDS